MTNNHPRCEMHCTGQDIFIMFNGKRIAYRGHPGTPQAKTWVSMERGYEVIDLDGEIEIRERLGLQ